MEQNQVHCNTNLFNEPQNIVLQCKKKEPEETNNQRQRKNVNEKKKNWSYDYPLLYLVQHLYARVKNNKTIM